MKGGSIMHIRIPFLAVLIITVFQLAVYGIQNNEHSTKGLDEVLTVPLDNITEISMTNLSRRQRNTTDPEQIQAFVSFLNQFQYKRLRNDETSYMPNRTMTINFYSDDEMDFIIPYEQEVFITHKVYIVKNGPIRESELVELFLSLPED